MEGNSICIPPFLANRISAEACAWRAVAYAPPPPPPLRMQDGKKFGSSMIALFEGQSMCLKRHSHAWIAYMPFA